MFAVTELQVSSELKIVDWTMFLGGKQHTTQIRHVIKISLSTGKGVPRCKQN